MGDYNIYLIVLCAMVLDYASGVLKAGMAGDIQSKAMREGLCHKAAYLFVIAAAMLVEYGSTLLPMGFDLPLVIPVCAGITLIEITSIIENVSQINPALKGSKLLSLFHTDGKAGE